ncbi:unnamed protein product [Sympodiomycopsis kandeliae]
MGESSAAGAAQSPESGTSFDVETVWTELHHAHATLAELKRQSIAASLHGLNADTCQSVGNSSSSSSSKRLSKEQFKQLITNLRSTAGDFRQNAQSLITQQPVQGSQINPNRYHSLLKERSQHVAQLHSAQDPLIALQRRLQQRRRKILPATLHVGALSADCKQNEVIKGKRKRQDDHDAYESGLPLDVARAALGSFSTALEDLAKDLQLETFAEVVDAPHDGNSYIHTHTLTIGGRLLVLDLEFGLQTNKVSVPDSALYTPSTKVKISFTTDTSHPTSASDGQDRERLTRCLQDDIEAIAGLIFGKEVYSQGENDTRCLEELKFRLAIAHYTRLQTNLARLATIDHQSIVKDAQHDQGTSAQTLDLFKANRDLSESIQRVALAEKEVLSDEYNSCSLITRGHGLPFLHAGRVGTTIVYNVHETSDAKSIENLLKAEQISLTLTDPLLHKAHVEARAATVGLHQPADHQPEARNLPSISQLSQSSIAGIGYVAHLDPPAILSRSSADRLHKTLGWPTGPSESHLSASSLELLLSSESKSDLWIGDLIRGKARSQSHQGASLVHLRLSHSNENQVRSEEQGLVVDTIPFSNTSQLYAAIEVIQESVSVGKLVQSVPMATSEATEGQVVDISFSGHGIKLHSTLVNEARLQAWHVTASISKSRNGEEAFDVQIDLVDQFGSQKAAFTGDDVQSVRNDLQSGLQRAAETMVKIADQRIGLGLLPLDMQAATSMAVDDSSNIDVETADQVEKETPLPEHTSSSVRVARRTSAATGADGSSPTSPSRPPKRRRSSG